MRAPVVLGCGKQPIRQSRRVDNGSVLVHFSRKLFLTTVNFSFSIGQSNIGEINHGFN